MKLMMRRSEYPFTVGTDSAKPRSFPPASLRCRPDRISILMLIPVMAVLLNGCGQPDTVDSEKTGTLTSDERYIVDLYMKINELERNLQDNPADSTKKWDDLKESIDRERVARILEELEKDPERWLPIYNRIEELTERRNR